MDKQGIVMDEITRSQKLKQSGAYVREILVGWIKEDQVEGLSFRILGMQGRHGFPVVRRSRANRRFLQVFSKFSLRSWKTFRLPSTKTPSLAPRLKASSPYEPVPAKRSRKVFPATKSPMEEKSRSLLASVAGLSLLDLVTRKPIPRARPPLILTCK